MSEWQPFETAPKGKVVMFGYAQQGDEMYEGLFCGIGIILNPDGKLWMLNPHDNERPLPSHWMPLPTPPRP